jgi:hypothetical protein
MNRMICFTALAVLLGGGRLEAAVSVDLADHEVFAYDASSNNFPHQVTDFTTIPISMDLTASTTNVSANNASAVTHLSRSTTLFDFSFEHLLSSVSPPSYADSAGYDDFTVTAPTQYTISGTYEMVGTVSITLDCYLLEDGTDYLFDNYQVSYSTTDQVFSLGSAAGDYSVLSGNLVGMLEPGHTYEFGYGAGIRDFSSNALSASASGDVSIAFSSAVPEPATLIIWSLLGGLGIAIAHWGKSEQARKGEKGVRTIFQINSSDLLCRKPRFAE